MGKDKLSSCKPSKQEYENSKLKVFKGTRNNLYTTKDETQEKNKP